MAEIKEDYVSFEIAKLLKEKGFDAEIDTYYSPEGKFKIWCPNGLKSYLDNKGTETWWWKCIAPTLQMTMKWLRIEHNIHIEPHIVKTRYSYGYMPNFIYLKKLKSYFPFDEFDFSNADKYACITYDKACEVAIKYCLKHLI